MTTISEVSDAFRIVKATHQTFCPKVNPQQFQKEDHFQYRLEGWNSISMEVDMVQNESVFIPTAVQPVSSAWSGSFAGLRGR